MTVPADEYGPFNAGPGASVGEAQWGRIYESLSSSGVSPQVLNQLRVTQRGGGANMSVDVASGQVFLMGHQGRWASISNLPISANPSGVTRYDRVIARADRTANIVVLDVKQGSGGVLAALTQDPATGVWESHVATITVAVGAATITNTQIDYHPIWAAGRRDAQSCLAGTDNAITQTLPTATQVIFQLGVPFVDTGPFWDVAHPTRLTAPADGLYQVAGQLQINEAGLYATPGSNSANVAKGARSITILLNGGSTLFSPQNWWWGVTPTAGGGGAPYGGLVPSDRIVGCAGQMPMVAGNYIELMAFQYSGGTMGVNIGYLTISRTGVL